MWAGLPLLGELRKSVRTCTETRDPGPRYALTCRRVCIHNRQGTTAVHFDVSTDDTQQAPQKEDLLRPQIEHCESCQTECAHVPTIEFSLDDLKLEHPGPDVI